MTHDRKMYIKALAEQAALHHGLPIMASALFECLSEIERLEDVVMVLRIPPASMPPERD